MTTQNLFPQDTRVLELATSGIFLTMALQLVVYGIDPTMAAIHPIQFWVCLFSVFGVFQLLANWYHPYAEVLRTFSALGAGALLLWLTLIGAVMSSVGIILAFSNLYAFLINFNLMRQEWKG